MNLHEQNFVCWPPAGPQDIKHKNETYKTVTSSVELCNCVPARHTRSFNDVSSFFGTAKHRAAGADVGWDLSGLGYLITCRV